jgi:hypothetical protein
MTLFLSWRGMIVGAAAALMPLGALAQSSPSSPNTRDTSACQGYSGESRQQCIEKMVNSANPSREADGRTGATADGTSDRTSASGGGTGSEAARGASAGGSQVPGAEGIGSGGSQGPGVGATGSGSSGTRRDVPRSGADHSIQQQRR